MFKFFDLCLCIQLILFGNICRDADVCICDYYYCIL
ncbi:hypothetical protein GLYMA_12G073651v4 [Glycine max]|nr:hypothetical protein GLYMA_12G073651v4 [Glycine max]KAH1142064.1 hypothetical protein GYH30_032983 [Glycine max]